MWSFTKTLFITLTAACLTLSGCATSSADKGLVGKEVPYVRFQSLDGEWRVLDEFRGKDTVLVFWAAWCSRSRSALQGLNQLARRSHGRDDRVFIAVNIDKQEDEEKFRSFVRDVPIDSFLHSYSGNDVYDEAFVRMNGEELPHIFIIDKTGKVADVGHSDKFVYEHFNEMK